MATWGGDWQPNGNLETGGGSWERNPGSHPARGDVSRSTSPHGLGRGEGPEAPSITREVLVRLAVGRAAVSMARQGEPGGRSSSQGAKRADLEHGCGTEPPIHRHNDTTEAPSASRARQGPVQLGPMQLVALRRYPMVKRTELVRLAEIDLRLRTANRRPRQGRTCFPRSAERVRFRGLRDPLLTSCIWLWSSVLFEVIEPVIDGARTNGRHGRLPKSTRQESAERCRPAPLGATRLGNPLRQTRRH